MGMIFTLKMLSDMSYFMYYAAFLASYFSSNPPPMAAVLLTAVCCGISHGFRHKPAAFRLSPFALCLFYFLLAGGLADFLILLPCLAYGILSCYKGLYDVNVHEMRDRFLLCIKIMPIVFILGLLSSVTLLKLRVLPFALVFFFTSVFLLRILRHDREVLSQTRFKILNTFSLIGAALTGIAFSSQTFFTALSTVMSAVYRVAIAPVLMAMAYVFVFIAWAIGPILRAIAEMFRKYLGEREKVEFEMSTEPTEPLDLESVMGTDMYELWDTIIRASIIILLCVIAFFVFKRLLGRRREQAEKAGALEQRISIEGGQKPRARVFRGPVEQVRAVYRKFLVLCRTNGLNLKPDLTSGDILSRVSMEKWGGEEAEALRDVYISARYEGGEVGRAQVKAAREHYAAIRALARKNRR